MTPSRAGFTLLETVVVLVLLALTTTVAAPAFRAAARRSDIDAAASTVARAFERARMQALTRGDATTLTVDPAGHRAWLQPSDTAFSLEIPRACFLTAAGPRAIVQFAADGSASGDVVVTHCGAETVATFTEPLTGAVRQEGSR